MEQRRSQRLIALGGVHRRLLANRQDSASKESTDRISINAKPPRKRGLWQEPDTVPPPSPFFSQQPHFEDGEPTILPVPTADENTENTPPPKRRQYIPPRPEEEAEEEEGEAHHHHHHRESGEEEEEMALEEEETGFPSQSLTSWFTPVRPTRPHPPSMNREARSTPGSTEMPSRMPSFAQWIDGVEISEEGENAGVAVKAVAINFDNNLQPRRGLPLPRGGGGGVGVDMSDLAMLYDSQIAASVGRSPPTPVEKILYNRE